MTYIEKYFDEAVQIIKKLDIEKIKKIVDEIIKIRKSKGRLFILGVGGGAANASHAVNDFRKMCGVDAYAPTDNVSELTARTNDEGWQTVFSEWLKISNLSGKDGIFVFSVGGGNDKLNISMNLVNALIYAKDKNAKIFGIVGRDGGYTAKLADICILIPVISPDTITPHTESFQLLIEHLIVSHPLLKTYQNKWESTENIK